jgi:hypothetical protein
MKFLDDIVKNPLVVLYRSLEVTEYHLTRLNFAPITKKFTGKSSTPM